MIHDDTGQNIEWGKAHQEIHSLWQRLTWLLCIIDQGLHGVANVSHKQCLDVVQPRMADHHISQERCDWLRCEPPDLIWRFFSEKRSTEVVLNVARKTGSKKRYQKRSYPVAKRSSLRKAQSFNPTWLEHVFKIRRLLFADDSPKMMWTYPPLHNLPNKRMMWTCWFHRFLKWFASRKRI